MRGFIAGTALEEADCPGPAADRDATTVTGPNREYNALTDSSGRSAYRGRRPSEYGRGTLARRRGGRDARFPEHAACSLGHHGRMPVAR
jgi:hypothetical protein